MSPTPIQITVAVFAALAAADQALGLALPSISTTTHAIGLALTAVVVILSQFAPAAFGKFKFKKPAA